MILLSFYLPCRKQLKRLIWQNLVRKRWMCENTRKDSIQNINLWEQAPIWKRNQIIEKIGGRSERHESPFMLPCKCWSRAKFFSTISLEGKNGLICYCMYDHLIWDKAGYRLITYLKLLALLLLEVKWIVYPNCLVVQEKVWLIFIIYLLTFWFLLGCLLFTLFIELNVQHHEIMNHLLPSVLSEITYAIVLSWFKFVMFINVSLLFMFDSYIIRTSF